MRSIPRLICFFTLLMCTALVCAQTNNSESNVAASGSPSAAPRTGHAQPTEVASLNQRMQNLARQLNLTGAQKEKIKPILMDADKQVDGLRGEASLTRERRSAKMKQIHENTLGEIRPVLSPEQQKKLDTMIAHMHQQPAGRTPQHRNDTQPK